MRRDTTSGRRSSGDLSDLLRRIVVGSSIGVVVGAYVAATLA